MSETPSLALVTGGSRGIGRACAKRLAKAGFTVYLTYVSRPELAKHVVQEIKEAGGQAKAFLLDSAQSDAVSLFFQEHIKGQGTLCVVVNNAGITRDTLLIRMKPADWDNVLSVNLSGSFYILQESAKIMSKQRQGSIINITSVVGQTGNVGQANYASAKAGLLGLTKSAAREFAGRNVRVNAIAPGFIESDMTRNLPENVVETLKNQIPMKALGQPEDVAATVAFLASEDSAYITGQVLAVNGGMYM